MAGLILPGDPEWFGDKQKLSRLYDLIHDLSDVDRSRNALHHTVGPQGAAPYSHAHTGYAANPHSHVEADVTSLVSDLAGKSPVGHTHTEANVTNLVSDLAAVAPIIGSLILYGGTGTPTNYLFCDGSAISRSTYAALFAVISTTYGVGDGSTTFNLPDLRTLFPRGANTTPGGTGGGGTHTHGVSGMGMTSTGTHDHGGNDGAAGSHDHSSPTGLAGAHSHGGTNSTSLAQASNTTATGASLRLTSPDPHSHTIPNAVDHQHTITSQGNHQHSITGAPNHNHTITGPSDATAAPVPPYLDLRFLIRAT